MYVHVLDIPKEGTKRGQKRKYQKTEVSNILVIDT